MSEERSQLINLPEELLGEILLRLAKINYCSLYTLAGTCRFLRDVCNQFVKQNPPEKFTKRHIIPEPTTSDEEDDDLYYYERDDYPAWDDVDDLVGDMYDRLSMGSGISDNDDENQGYALQPEWYAPDDGDNQQVNNTNHDQAEESWD